MTTEERLQQVDFSQFSKVKDSLLLRLKLRRRAIIEEMSLEELDQVTAAGNSILQVFDEKKKNKNNPAGIRRYFFRHMRGEIITI